MDKSITADASVDIHAPAARVWDALLRPELIAKYFFGSQIVTDWKVGSPIVYKGTYQGKSFEDKGQVVEVKPEKSLVVTHWSPLSGVPDIPENYHTVRYELAPENGNTRVTIRQDNNANEQERQESAKLWKTVLENMKKMLEEK